MLLGFRTVQFVHNLLHNCETSLEPLGLSKGLVSEITKNNSIIYIALLTKYFKYVPDEQACGDGVEEKLPKRKKL